MTHNSLAMRRVWFHHHNSRPSFKEGIMKVTPEEMFTALCNAEHRSWIAQSEPSNEAHLNWKVLQYCADQIGFHDLITKAIFENGQERKGRYTDE